MRGSSARPSETKRLQTYHITAPHRIVMIIPIRCFTCGKVIADKWRSYERQCAEADALTATAAARGPAATQPAAGGGAAGLLDTSPRDKILDGLGLTRMCCRRHMLTHVDLHTHA